MSFRRRHRWLRRLALGLAVAGLATVNAASAYAKADSGNGVAVYVTGSAAPAVQGEEAGSKVPAGSQPGSAIRPDDRRARFAHSEVAPRPEPASTTSWTFERSDALFLGIGSLVLALGLGLALGSTSRPRIAGL